MRNLQTLITGSFSTRQVSNPAQPCLKGRFPMNESPKSVIKDSVAISSESASSDSMDHSVRHELNSHLCRELEDLTSDESSTCSSFKKNNDSAKLSKEIACDQTNDLLLHTLLQAGSCEIKDPISVSGNGVSRSPGSGSRSNEDVLNTTELHDLIYAGSTNVNKSHESQLDSFSNISSKFELNQASHLSTEGYFTTHEELAHVSELIGCSPMVPLTTNSKGDDSHGKKSETIRQKVNGSQPMSVENTKMSDSPRSPTRHSKMQDVNTPLTSTQIKGRSDSFSNSLKTARLSPRNVQVKAVRHSPTKPSPSKWDDAQKWLISPVSTEVTTHSQAGAEHISSPKFGASLPNHNESTCGKKFSGSDQNLRMLRIPGVTNKMANKLETPLSQGSPRHFHVPDKHMTVSQEYVSKCDGIQEKPACGRKQKPQLEGRTTRVIDVHKPSLLSSTSSYVGSLLKADTEADILKVQETVSPRVNLSTGPRAFTDSTHPTRSRILEKLSTNVRENNASLANMNSFDVHMTDKYADTVVKTPDCGPNANEFLVQTPKLGALLPMKDVSTEVSPSVSRYRDMGTQMTPVSSSRPSKCVTPISNISPARHNTPAKQAASSEHASVEVLELHTRQLMAKLENRDVSFQSNFNGLERSASCTWSTREEEEEESSKSLRCVDLTEIRKSIIEARAVAWEEAEQAKRTLRYKREESKIQAWENHEKAKAEAELRKLEVKLEKMRSHQTEKIMNKLTAAHQHAENMRAAAQAEHAEQLAKCRERANQMRISGNVPTSFCACFTIQN